MAHDGNKSEDTSRVKLPVSLGAISCWSEDLECVLGVGLLLPLALLLQARLLLPQLAVPPVDPLLGLLREAWSTNVTKQADVSSKVWWGSA